MTSDITDKSLLRCTVKKSVRVTERLIVYASFAVVATTIVAIAAFGALNILPPLLELASRLMACVWTVLTSIPWYYYAGAAAIGAIPAYSFLWCVARDLTEEDWRSESASDSALAVATFAFALTLTLALALAFATFAFATFAFAFALTLALAVIAVLAVLAFAVDPVSEITIWYHIFRFPGAAWHHYRKGDQ